MKNEISIIEKAIEELGVEAEMARCSNPGEWMLQRSGIDIYLDLWKADKLGWQENTMGPNDALFQLTMPLFMLDDPNPLELFQDLLFMNFSTVSIAWMYKPQVKVVALISRINAKHLNTAIVKDLISEMAEFAVYVKPRLEGKFPNLKSIEGQPNE